MLMTSAPVASQGKAQEEVLLPEIAVTGEAESRQHPQDGNYSDRPLGCVEVVTPSSGGNELGGSFFARFAKEGIPVIPDLNDPSGVSDSRPDRTGKAHQATPPGQEGSNKCVR